MIKEEDESIRFINEESPYQEKPVSVERTTMSVPEMRKLLGLGKTDSYWLVHKKVFETVLVNGKMRINLESFERWYSMQIKYKKVDGPPPGDALKQLSYSPRDIAQMLRISETTAYDIINRNHLETVLVDCWMRVPADVFERWYNSQTRYRTQADREREAIERERERANGPREPKNPNYYTIEEIHYFFGIHRSTVYKWIKEGTIPARRVGSSWRIPREEFEDWIDYRGC